MHIWFDACIAIFGTFSTSHELHFVVNRSKTNHSNLSKFSEFKFCELSQDLVG